MKSIVFATANEHKLREIKALLGNSYQIISLADLGHTEDIPETGETFHANALIKAAFVKEHYGRDCFSEDSGLEIDALNGAPGVYTARYAGPGRDADDNMDLVLKNLEGVKDRSARFRTVIALIQGGATHYFEGTVEGRIAESKSGEKGFGYDPIFIPEGYDRTFATFTDKGKNAISHRGQAVAKLVAFLQAN